MVRVLNSRLEGLGSSPGSSHCVVFSGKKLHSHSASPLRSMNGYWQTGRET